MTPNWQHLREIWPRVGYSAELGQVVLPGGFAARIAPDWVWQHLALDRSIADTENPEPLTATADALWRAHLGIWQALIAVDSRYVRAQTAVATLGVFVLASLGPGGARGLPRKIRHIDDWVESHSSCAWLRMPWMIFKGSASGFNVAIGEPGKPEPAQLLPIEREICRHYVLGGRRCWTDAAVMAGVRPSQAPSVAQAIQGCPGVAGYLDTLISNHSAAHDVNWVKLQLTEIVHSATVGALHRDPTGAVVARLAPDLRAAITGLTAYSALATITPGPTVAETDRDDYLNLLASASSV